MPTRDRSGRGRTEGAGSIVAAPRISRMRIHTEGPFLGQVETFHPHRSRDGTYTLGPRQRQDRHHAAAKVSTSDLAEVARLLGTKQYCLRMRGDLTGKVNMMRPDAITVEEAGGDPSPDLQRGEA